VSGEINIDDVAVFYPTGRMSKVWLMWETVRRFASLLDDAHAKEILSLEGMLKKYDGTEITSEDQLDDLFVINDLHSQTSLSSKVLVNAAVLHLLTSFVEFVLKEILKLVQPGNPLPRGLQNLITPLEAKGIFTGYPESYLKHVHDHRESVRNGFAHGDWENLAVAVGSLDLDGALFGTVELVWSMQRQLEEQGYDLTTPTITPVKLPEGF
jgi:hypothetical protein